MSRRAYKARSSRKGKPRRAKPKPIKVLTTRFTGYRVKKRALVSFGAVIPWWPRDGFLLTERPLERAPYASQELIEYSYCGDTSVFNVCSHSIDATSPRVDLGRIMTWRDDRIGWASYADCLCGKPPQKVNGPNHYYAYLPTSTVEIPVQASDVTAKRYACYLNVCAGLPERHMNIARSVFELKDTRQTLTSLTDFALWAARNVRYPRGTSMAMAANAYLTYIFGIAPTIKDLNQFIEEASKGQLAIHCKPTEIPKGTVLKSYYRLKPDQATLNSYQPTTFYRKRWEDWCGSNGVFYKSTNGNYPYCPLKGLRALEVDEYRGCMFAKANQNIVFDGAETARRKFRWNCPIGKTAWDLTGLSFLLDWFVTVGREIELLDKQAMLADMRVDVSTVWHSATRVRKTYYPLVKYTSRVEQIKRYASTSPMWGVSREDDIRVIGYYSQPTGLEFDRRPFLIPEFPLVPSVRWPVRAYQLSAGAALLAANAKQISRLVLGKRK